MDFLERSQVSSLGRNRDGFYELHTFYVLYNIRENWRKVVHELADGIKNQYGELTLKISIV